MSFNCPYCTCLCKLTDTICLMCFSSLNISDDIIQNISQANETEKLIDNNFKKAYEEIPEFFFPKKMIFIKGKINGYDIKFLLDTGASITVINRSLARALKIDHLVDKKYQGELRGVGIDKIAGKIHYTEILFDFGIVPASITVCNNDKLEPILGMDFIQSHGLILDFKKRLVFIGNNSIEMFDE